MFISFNFIGYRIEQINSLVQDCSISIANAVLH